MITTYARARRAESAVAWGATGVYRLDAGDIRILYEVDDQAETVAIINVGIIT